VRTTLLGALVVLAWPVSAGAQLSEPFVRPLVDFANAVIGSADGDSGEIIAALDAMDAGLVQWAAAVQKVEAALAGAIASADPQTASRMRAALGTAYLEQGRRADARAQFEAAAALDPQFAAARFLSAAVGEAAGPEGRGAGASASAIANTPLGAYLWLRARLGGQTSSLDWTDDVVSAFRVLAAASRPGAQVAPFPVVALLEEAAVRAPLFLGARYAPGVRLLALGQHRDAAARFREAALRDPLIADPVTRSAEYSAAVGALRRRNPDAAIAAATNAATLHPSSSEARRVLGVALWSAGQRQAAARAFRAAVDVDAADERSWTALADVLFEAKDAAGARDVLLAATQAVPDSGLARWKLGRLLATLGDGEGALRAYEAAAAIPAVAGLAHVHADIGRLHHDALDLDAAAAAYRRRLALTPNVGAAHVDLAEVLRAQEKLQEALLEYLMAALLDPGAARPLAMAGLVYASAGRDGDAVEMLRRAIAIDADHLEARYALSRALLRLGKTQEAEAELAAFQRLQAKAMEEERRRFRDNQSAIDATLAAPPDRDPAR
jgi:tetratricopeptide (TPR) repeat protein